MHLLGQLDQFEKYVCGANITFWKINREGLILAYLPWRLLLLMVTFSSISISVPSDLLRGRFPARLFDFTFVAAILNIQDETTTVLSLMSKLLKKGEQMNIKKYVTF